jgi:ankyrin repeat protein
VVGVLADAGAEVDCVDQHGRTPLMKAVANGHLATVRRLVANQASVDAVDSSG